MGTSTFITFTFPKHDLSKEHGKNIHPNIKLRMRDTKEGDYYDRLSQGLLR